MFVCLLQNVTDSVFYRLEEEGKAEQERGFIIPAKHKEKKQEEEEDSDSDDGDTVGPLPPGPMPPPAAAPAKKVKKKEVRKEGGGEEESSSEDSVEGEEIGETSAVDRIPWSHEIKLQHGDKAITSLALDPGGARVLSGGIDYEMKFWDFAGMDPSLRSFRGKKPMECHALNDIKYSVSGDKILVIANTATFKVLGRDGDEMWESVKGDQYVLDQTRNKGHINQVNILEIFDLLTIFNPQINAGCWHPKLKDELMTCSSDATMRIWNIELEGKKSKSLIKCKNRKSGLRCHPTSCTYSRLVSPLFLLASSIMLKNAQ